MNQSNLGQNHISKIKAENHISAALKKHLREIKQEIQVKDEEITRLKKNIRITRFNELEMEVKTYMDECNRLRGLARDIIKCKDPLMDPQQKSEIDKRFMEQTMIIEQLRNENANLENAFQDREMEVLRLKELIDENENPQKVINKDQSLKEKKKHSKIIKSKVREISKLK